MPQNRLAHQVVADRYELLETVGRGGFGTVWRACDTLLQRHVAVKEIHIPGFLNDEERAGLREKVLKEARAAARLDHPGAVTVFDVIDDDGHPVIVMELVEAPNLSQLVQEQGPLAPAAAARIGLEVLDVLDAAHSHGIVHRDVKPANVMVSESGRVRLGDFGVAAILDDPTVTSSGAITGSPAYMAPEQATNKGAVPASDLWSLGATLYFAVEGRPPFDKGAPLPTLTSIVQDPPRPWSRAAALGVVIDGLLVKDPDARLSGAQLRRQLERVAATEPVAQTASPGDTMVLPEPPAAPPVTRRPPAAKAVAPRRSSSGVAWAVGVAGILVVALLAFALSSRDADSPSGTAPEDPPTSAAAGSPGSTAGANRTATTARGDRVAYTDPQTGFSIAYPKGWTIRTDGTLTDFRDPDTGAYLRVDHIEPPGPSPEGAWFELEKSFAAENENYRRIRIEPTTYNGYRAGIWEFTYTSGGAQLHVVDLGFITPRYGFALYFQTRAGDWDRMQSTFQAFKDSFKAPA
ncbi:MAG TPA: protein kinase [Acidimicrobiales bacterium]|nr:protein kinase [Acidimicrobiales bacterium]